MSGVNYKEFSAKIKSKYPQYANVDDLELAKKIVEKYPEYSDQVLFDEVPTDDESVRKAKEDVYGVSYKPDDTAPEDNRMPSADNLPETLSYREDEKETVPNYFGLFDKKEVVDTANKLGVSVGFFDKVGEAAAQAEYAPEKLYEAFEIKQKAEALKKHFPEVAAEADSILSDLVGTSPNKLEDISARLNSLEGSVASYVEEQPTLQYRGYINDTYDDPLSMATKRMIENTRNLKKAATEDATAAGRVIRGTGKGIQQYVEGFTKIVQEMASNRAVVEINDKLGKVANGEDVKFTDQERMFLKVMVDNAKIQDEYGKRIGISYKIGEAFGQSLGFMAEFVMTGGMASGATKLGQGAKVVSKAVQIGRATKVGKVATNMAIKAAQAGVQTLGMPSFYQKVAVGVSNGDTFGDALLDSYWQMWAENMSERIFMSKVVPGKEGINALDRMLGRMGTTMTTEKGVLGVLKSTLEESAEEKIGEILTAPKDHDNFLSFWKSFTDVEQNKIMLGSVSLMTGIMGSPVVALNAYDKVSTGIKVDQLKKVLDADITSGIDKIYSEKDLTAKDAMSLVFDLLNGKIEQLPRDTNYPQVIHDALRYAQLKAKHTAMSGITEKEFNELINERKKPVVEPVEEVEEAPELTEQEKQIEYLKSRGQVIPAGTDMETLNKMFSAEKTKERAALNTEIDTKVKAAQEKLGLPQTPDIEISEDTEATLERLDEGLPVTNEFIKSASDELYSRYRELEAMKTADTRLYTTEQIESMQGYLGEEIERLENYASEQKETGKFVGEVKSGEVTEGKAEGVAEGVSEVVGASEKPVEAVSKESGQVVPAEEKVAVKPSEEVVEDVSIADVETTRKNLSKIESINPNIANEIDVIPDDIILIRNKSYGVSGLKKKLPFKGKSVFAVKLSEYEKLKKYALDNEGVPMDNWEIVDRRNVDAVALKMSETNDWVNDYTDVKPVPEVFDPNKHVVQFNEDGSVDYTPGVAYELLINEPSVDSVAKAYHAAKKSGSNVKLVNQVEQVLGGSRDAVQEQEAVSVPVQPAPGVGEKVEGRAPEAKPEEVAGEKKEVKKESDDKKRKRRLQRTDRQPAANGQPIVGKGETSAQGVRLVDGTIVKAGDEVVYKGETRKVRSVKGDIVTIPGVGDVHKSKVLAPTKPVQDTRGFTLEETNPNKVNDDLLSDEVFDRMRMNNIEPSDTDVLGTAALAKSLMNGDISVDAAIDAAVSRFADRGTVPDHVPFFKAAPGAKHTSPYATYNDAVRGRDNVGKNLWVRNTPSGTNKNRVLLVQFSSNFLYGKQPFKRDKNSSYFDKLYRLVAGYNRTVDFWEVPLWMARIAGLQRNADVYVVRDIEEAKKFINEAGYESVHFSALDVNEKHIVDIIGNTPGTKYQIGGYTDFKRIEAFPNVTVYKSIDEYVKNNKLEDTSGRYSYRHFKGTAVIPRLKLSEGCLYKCAFCSIPKKVIPVKKEWVDSQIESIKDLDATLVYLDDKTFGQAENYTLLPELYERIKEYNPDFKGFIIQTTALDFANKKRFSPEYLKNSHIQFVELGVETYNDDILTKLNKKHSHKKFVDAAMQNARENNIKVIPNIIVGLSWNEGTKEKPVIKTETKQTYQNTLDFLEDNKDIISHVNVYSLALYEGTELSDSIEVKEEADKNENIIAKSWQENKEDHEWAMDEFSDFASNQIEKDEVQKEEKGLRNEKVNARFKKIAKQTGTDVETVTKMYDTLMSVFGLSQDKALAGAVIVDRMVGTMAKRTNKTKAQVYATIKWEKGVMEEIMKMSPLLQSTLWHGSPYQFEKFTTEKIGTGEGAQAFGWGLYFTELEGVARYYAKKLGKRNIIVDKSISNNPLAYELVDEYWEEYEEQGYSFREFVDLFLTQGKEGIERARYDIASVDDQVERLRQENLNERAKFNNAKKSLADVESLDVPDETKDTLRKFFADEVKRMEGNIRDFNAKDAKEYLLGIYDKRLKENERIYESAKFVNDNIDKYKRQRIVYKVTVHKGKTPDEYEWLEWDKKITDAQISKIEEKDKSVGEVLSNWSKNPSLTPASSRSSNITGDNVYRYLTSYFNSDKEASLFLLRAGIDGIKYPAESLSGKPTRGFNFVVFDENAITIEDAIKFQQRVLGRARGAQIWQDAYAVIYALTDPNVTTPLHELAHVYEKYLTAKEKEQILKWTGEKSWSISTSESFARGFERFLYDGTAPGNLKAIFQKFAAWLKDIYKGLVASEINVTLNEDMRRIYSTMLGSEYVEEKVPTEPSQTAEEAADAYFGSAPVDADGNIILSDEDIADQYFSGLEVDENGVIKFQMIGTVGAARLDAAENNNNRIFNLREAMKMTDANKTAEEIKFATGWEKGKDKRWRYEIPDNMKMRTAWDKLKVSDFNDKYELPITEAMDYPELFAAYPELEKIKIRKDTAFLDIFQSVQGWYDHDSMELVVSPNAIDPFGTILHELQHAVQMVEGFATGSNTEDIIDAIPDFEFESVVDQLVEQLERDIKKNTEKNLTRRKILSGLTAKEEADIRRYSKEIIAAREEGDRLYKEEKKKFPDKNPYLDNKKLAELRLVKYELRDKINDIIERVLGERSITLAVEFSFGIEAVEEYIDETSKKIIEDNKAKRSIEGGADKAYIIKNFSPVLGDMAYNYYKRVAGETEARNVAARAKLTPEQRKSTAESTEDVPRDKQIVMRGGKIVSMDMGKMTVTVDGKKRPVLNSEGRPIHNTEEGIINFWKWFGDSKVVDEQGRPLVVYHGGSFNESDSRGMIGDSWFTVTKRDASYYAKQSGGSTTSAYLSIQTPLFVGDVSSLNLPISDEVLISLKKRGNSNSIVIDGKHITFIEPNAGVLLAKDIGRDGIIDLRSREIMDVVVWNPSQIKSTTGNVGTFSPETGNILFQEPKTERQKGVELLANIGRKGVIRPSAEKLIRDWLATKQYKVDESLIKDALDSLTFTTVSPIGFYSTVENALTKISQSKGTPEQFKAMLLNNGAKQAEMDWMGFDGHFTGKSITKDEVQEWIDQNKIEVEEVAKGLADLEWEQSGNTYKYGDYEIEKSETSGKYIVYHKDGGGFIGSYSNIDGAKNFVEAQLSVGEKRTLTEYSQYVTPGGKNYKELLLTMKPKPIPYTVESRMMPTGKRWYVVDPDGKVASEPFYYRSEAEHVAHRRSEIADVTTHRPFGSAHWSEEDVLVHVRFDERTDADGKRVLFVEEIQSDWAQEGKKKGFRSDKKFNAELRDLYAELDRVDRELNETIKQARDAGMPTGASSSQWREFEKGEYTTPDTYRLIDLQNTVRNNRDFNAIQAELDAIRDNQIRIGKDRDRLIREREKINAEIESAKDYWSAKRSKAVPDMPFKNTEQWVNLAIRRVIRYAAENGFDRVAWTTGEQQAARYDLSKQLSAIHIEERSGKYLVDVWDKSKNKYIDRQLVKDQNELSELIGKDMTNKFLTEREKGYKSDYFISEDPYGNAKMSFEGLDLKVGGEGMKAFYDKIIPAAVSKLGKPFNAKVESTNIRNIDINTFQETPYYAVQSISITQTMRESAMEGMPLFQAPKSKRDIAVDMLYGLIRNETSKEAARARIDAYLTSRGWKLGVDGGNIVAEAIARLGLSEAVVEAPMRPGKEEPQSKGGIPAGGSERLGDGKTKKSKLGLRLISGKSNIPDNVKALIEKNRLHEYRVLSHEEGQRIAKELYDTNGLVESYNAFFSTKMHSALEVYFGANIIMGMKAEIEQAEKDGRNGDADYWSDQLLKFSDEYIHRVSVERAQGLNALGSAFIQSLFPSRAYVRKYINSVNNARAEVLNSKPFKKKLNRAKDEFKEVRSGVVKTVLEELEEKVIKIKGGASLRDLMKEKKRLLDELKATKDRGIKMSIPIPNIPGLSQTEVAYGTSIASLYIQGGIYGEKLVEKLIKDFDTVGITVTEEQAFQMIPTRMTVGGVEMDTKDVIKENETSKAALRLANRIFGSVIVKQEKNDPISAMLNILMSKFNERNIRKPENIKVPVIYKIADAIRNKEIYADVWDEAKDTALGIVEDSKDLTDEEKASAKQLINDSYDNATSFTFTEKQVDEAIRNKAKELNILIRDIVSAHYDIRARHMGTITNALIIDADLTAEEATVLAQAINRRYNTLMAERGKKLLERYTKHLTETQKRSATRKKEEDRLLELINIGAFDDPSFTAAFANARGMKKIEPDVIEEIKRRAEEVQKQKSAKIRARKLEDLLGYMAHVEGTTFMDKMEGLWFAQVLGRIPTQLRNIIGALTGITSDAVAMLTTNPTDAIPSTVNSLRRAGRWGKQSAGDVIRNGYTSYIQKIETPRVTEYLHMNPERVRRAFRFVPFYWNHLKYTSRLLGANDVFHMTTAKEIWVDVLTRRGVMIDGKKYSRYKYFFDSDYRREVDKIVNKEMFISKEQIDGIKAEIDADAITYGYTSSDKKIAMMEAIDMLRPAKVVETATWLASTATGNVPTYGTLGFLTDRLAETLKNIGLRRPQKTESGDWIWVPWKPFYYAAAFTKITSNVVSRMMEFAPGLGALRYFSGSVGFFYKDEYFIGANKNKFARYYRELSEEEKNMVGRRQLIGTAFMLAMYFLSDPGDDDDPIVRITANGTGNYSKNKETLEGADWKEYSVGIKTKEGRVWLPYRLTPLALVLAPLGWMRDKKRHNVKYKDVPDAIMFLKAMQWMPWFIGDVTAIMSMNEVLNGLFSEKSMKDISIFVDDGSGEAVNDKVLDFAWDFTNNIVKSFVPTIKGFYTPMLYPDIVKMWEWWTERELDVEPNQFKRLINLNPVHVFFEKEKGMVYMDVFGRETTRPLFLSEFFDYKTSDDISAYHVRNADALPATQWGSKMFEIRSGSGLVSRTLDPNDAKDEVLMWYYTKRRAEYLLRGVDSSEGYIMGIEALKAYGITGEKYQEAVNRLDYVAQQQAKDDVMEVSAFDLPYLRRHIGR